MKIEIGQIIAQIISFLFMLWILKKYAWKPLLSIMEERKNKIQSEFGWIEEQKKEIEKRDKEYKEKLKGIDVQARAKIQEATKEGQQIAQKLQREAYDQAKAIIAKTQVDLKSEIQKAKRQLKDDLVKISLAATQKIIQDNLNVEKQTKLVEEFVEQGRFD